MQYNEQDLRQLQSQIMPLAEAFDLVADHVVITDRDGYILYANKGVEKHTGFSIAEMIGKRPGDLWGGLMEEPLYVEMWKVIKQDKRPFVGEVQNRNKDGVKYWQDLRIYPVLGEDSEVQFFIGMEPDITIRKVAEGVEAQYTAEMERINKYLSGRVAKLSELVEELGKLKKSPQNKNNQSL